MSAWGQISSKPTSGPNNFRLSRHWQLSRDVVRTEMTASMPSLANKILMSAKVAWCDRIVLLYNVQRGIDLRFLIGSTPNLGEGEAQFVRLAASRQSSRGTEISCWFLRRVCACVCETALGISLMPKVKVLVGLQ